MGDFLAIYDESDNFEPSPAEQSPLCEQLARVTEAYNDEELIATGGMKSISKVFSNNTQRYVAKATLNTPENLELREAFIREARLTARLDHPNIIKIHDIGLDENQRPYFTMDLKSGDNLGKLLHGGKCTRRELLIIFMKISI